MGDLKDHPETTVLEARYFNTDCKASLWAATEISLKN